MRRLTPFFFSASSTLLVLAVAAPAHAQVNFGVRVGANAATFAQDLGAGQPEASIKARLGGQVGAVLHVRFGKFAFQPALLFSQKGYTDDGDPAGFSATDTRQDTTVTVRSIVKRKGTDYLRLNYLEVPLNLVYTVGGDHGIQLIAGPYVAIGVGGKQHTDGGTVDFQTTKTVGGRVVFDETVRFAEIPAADKGITYAAKLGKGDDLFVRRLDVGLTGGVGYWFGPVQVQVLYGWGLRNLVPNDEDDEAPEAKLHHRVGQLTLTYLLGTR